MEPVREVVGFRLIGLSPHVPCMTREVVSADPSLLLSMVSFLLCNAGLGWLAAAQQSCVCDDLAPSSDFTCDQQVSMASKSQTTDVSDHIFIWAPCVGI